jgi:hypothetical protein
MLSAYVLIETEVGKTAQVGQAIRAIEGVQWADANAAPNADFHAAGWGQGSGELVA